MKKEVEGTVVVPKSSARFTLYPEKPQVRVSPLGQCGWLFLKVFAHIVLRKMPPSIFTNKWTINN